MFDALFKDLGQPGSRVEHPRGETFHLAAAEGAGHTHRNLTVPLPNGGAVSHLADIAFELENGRLVYVDIFDAHAAYETLKAAAFDAIHLKKARSQPFAVLVVVRSPRSLIRQETVEALAYPYDYVFGIDEESVVYELKFAACRSEIVRRVKGEG